MNDPAAPDGARVESADRRTGGTGLSTDGATGVGPRGQRGALIAGRYRLEQRLASGAMADVWTALDEVLTRRVALKVLKPIVATDPVLRERFRREAQLAARLNHRNVVAIYDTLSEESPTGDPVEAVVQELVPGETLKDHVDVGGRTTIGEAVRIGIAVADALDAVHRAGIVHRDVKPANILLADDGRVLLTDFGIATHGRQDLTRDDVMMGTAKYLSPEQVEGRPATTAADLYSLGIVLYECLTGRAPFSGESEAATALARLRADAIPLRAVRPGVPHRLAGLVAACMARRPADRPLSASVVRQALVRILPGVVEDLATEPAPLRPRFPGRTGPRPSRRHARHSPADAPAVDQATDSPSGTEFAGHVVPLGGPDGSPSPETVPASSDVAIDAATDGRATDTRATGDHRTGDTETGGDAGSLDPGNGTAPGRRRVARRIGRGLLYTAVGVGVLVFTTVLVTNRSDRPVRDTGERPIDLTAATTVVTTATSLAASTAPTTPTTAARAEPTDPVIVSTAEFDPPPGDGKENPALLARMLDGNADTYWTSLCYDDPGLGQKDGIGVVFELSADAANHRLEIQSTTRGWSASVFVAATRPDRLRAWGSPVASQRDVSASLTSFALGPAHGTFVLLWFTQLGASEACRLPYAVRVGEAGIQP